MALRPEVQAFADLMETTLRRHDARKGVAGWKTATADKLYHQIGDKVDEFRDAYYSLDTDSMLVQSVDLANLLMMLTDIVRAIPEVQAETV